METIPSNSEKMMAGPKMEDVTLEQVLYALSDLSRIRIVQMIHESGGELRCGTFAEKIGISKPTCSHHFGILRQHGVISTRIDGTQKLNTIRREELNRRFPGLIDSILKALPEW